ncbi:MAG: hypothetical protein IPH13_19170 [Planctomycetes bacterium]|nr:hypothetical protein [Planctomycetota bacterium]MCC7169646.1 hypothetical protein [Planctomycetota bacterium]
MNSRISWITLSIVLVGAIGTCAWGTDTNTAVAKKAPKVLAGTAKTALPPIPNDDRILQVGTHPARGNAPKGAASAAKPRARVAGPHAEKAPATSIAAVNPAAEAAHDAPIVAEPATPDPNTDLSTAAPHASVAADPATAIASAPAGDAQTVDVDAIWSELLAGNQRFVAGTPATRELVASRTELAKGQHPTTIVLACADSRVAPELVFDQSLGDLFVVRTAGNIADEVALGSIEYAIEHLGARVLVVLGHEHCGAVKAAASGATMPTPNLQAIVDRIAPALDDVRPFAVADQLAELGVAANVHRSAGDLIVNSPIVHEAIEHGSITLIRAVYRLESGEVVRLAEPAGAHAHAMIEFEVDPSSTAMELAEQK